MDKEELVNLKKIPDLSKCMSGIIRELEVAGKYASVHTYTCTLHSFTNFYGEGKALGEEAFGAKAPSIPVNEVFTAGSLKSYQEWLLRKGLSWNSISTYMRTLRAVANRIYPPDSAEYVSGLFNDVYTKVESRTKRALTESQMQSLFNIDLETLPPDARQTLSYFKLMFLFRGMPFIDLAHLRKHDIQGNLITYCRHKTGKQLAFRIPEEAVPLLKEYSDRTPGSIYLFPILDSGLQSGIQLHHCYLDALRRFNKGLRKLSAQFLPDAKLSSYTARHTWATLAYHMGTAVGIISEALGHSSIRVTETYLKPFAREQVDKANENLIAIMSRDGRLKNKVVNGLFAR